MTPSRKLATAEWLQEQILDGAMTVEQLADWIEQAQRDAWNEAIEAAALEAAEAIHLALMPYDVPDISVSDEVRVAISALKLEEKP